MLRRSRSILSKPTVLVAGLAGAGIAFLFDPVRGKARRSMIGQKLSSLVNRAETRVDRASQYAAGEAQGLRAKLQNLPKSEQPPPNAQTLVDKVRSEIFQGLQDEVDSGAINVDASEGVVTLRGEVKHPELVNELEARARKITGVVDVVNFLHTPGTTPQNVQEALDASRGGSSLPLDAKPQPEQQPPR